MFSLACKDGEKERESIFNASSRLKERIRTRKALSREKVASWNLERLIGRNNGLEID
jgi:hypothetical protein